MVSIADIVRHHDPDPNVVPWVHGPPAPTPIEIVDYKVDWPHRYLDLAAAIRAAMGAKALNVDHVGSTAVVGMAAKDVIDIDLTVAHPSREHTYLPALEPLGYHLVIREPHWYEHRCLCRDEPRVNLHVFGPDSPEPIRHRIFRDWLTTHPDARATYREAKLAAIPGGGTGMDYNTRKTTTIRDIYQDAFHAAGLI